MGLIVKMCSDFRDIRMLERICVLEWIKDSDLLEFLFWHFLRRPEKTCWSPGSPCPIPSPSSFPPVQGSKGHQSEESTKERSGYGLPRSKGTRGTPQIPASALHLGLLHLCQSLCLSGKGRAPGKSGLVPGLEKPGEISAYSGVPGGGKCHPTAHTLDVPGWSKCLDLFKKGDGLNV